MILLCTHRNVKGIFHNKTKLILKVLGKGIQSFMGGGGGVGRGSSDFFGLVATVGECSGAKVEEVNTSF